MKIEEAELLVPGDKVMCVELTACALEDIRDLFEWEVVSVLLGPTIRVLMQYGEQRQLVAHQNIAGKVGQV